jgi:hypothetical protein
MQPPSINYVRALTIEMHQVLPYICVSIITQSGNVQNIAEQYTHYIKENVSPSGFSRGKALLLQYIERIGNCHVCAIDQEQLVT